MTRQAALLTALLLAPLDAGPAVARVTVAYDDPSRFTDADRAGGIMTAEAAARSLDAHLEALGARLPAGRDVEIRIIDVDLAGRLAPERALAPSTRFMDASTWPRVRLVYRSSDRGRLVAEAAELVDRKDYLRRPTARYAGDPLRFEKTMLEEWFDRRIAGQGARAALRQFTPSSSWQSAGRPPASPG